MAMGAFPQQLVIEAQVKRLLADVCQARLGRQVELGRQVVGRERLVQAQGHGIQMRAAAAQRLFDRSGDRFGRIGAVQTEDAHELTDGTRANQPLLE